MTSTYRFFAYDINTNTKITEIAAAGCTFDTRLNDAGAFSGTLNLADGRTAATAAPLQAYNGWPHKLYVVDTSGPGFGVIVWSGYVWQSNYQKSTSTLTLSGKEMLSFADMRVAVAEYSQKNYPTGLRAEALLQKVINDAQDPVKSGLGASWGLQVSVPVTALASIIPGYPLSQKTKLSQIISDITQIIQPGVGGIDVTISTQFDTNGNPVDTFNIWYPRAGNNSTQTGVVFDLDTALDYTWPLDGSQAGTNIDVTGAGNGNAMPEQVIQSPWTPVGGLGQPPRLDIVESYSHIQSQAQINAMAGGVASQFGQPLLTPTVLIPASGNLGTWTVGDDAVVKTAGDPRFPLGMSTDLRIVEYSTTLADFGVSTTLVTLNQPPQF